MSESGVTSKIAVPYSEALMSLAQSQDLTDRFGEDAGALIALLKESEDLRQFLANPVIDRDTKKAVIQQILGEQVHPLIKNFLMLLVDHNRIIFLEDICKQYQARLRELKRAVLAEVTSVVELSEDQKQVVREKVKAATGAQEVELETRIDPSLLGGVLIQVGSQIYDLSLRGQLRRLSLQLSSTA
ncbi:F0F1 ATP synthase subunit delta [Kovacikia minuta CCNUW1]|uniref:ATP synthase F1 subunit delta n=1 Tax=Kovacikia minuta TaxID=2931930 RepID=UPI001CCA0F72|nr:ATP synthase F1 subunit delta [Kovacikia minuta]UBF27283.1 F0F1 ATP synthase subunit delta [Kovacikia minuta CCNUW1]